MACEHRRSIHLILAIACFLVCLLVLLSTVGRTEEPPAWTLGGYGILSFAGSMGYRQPGIGLQAEGSARWKFLELWGNVHALDERKRDAKSGYTYGWGVQGRGYVYGPWYISANYNFGGYHTEFESGTVWEKNAGIYGVGVGCNNYDSDVGLVYFFKEYGSPNRIQSTKLNYRQRLYKCLWLSCDIAYSMWDQGAERWSGWSETVGLGVKW